MINIPQILFNDEISREKLSLIRNFVQYDLICNVSQENLIDVIDSLLACERLIGNITTENTLYRVTFSKSFNTAIPLEFSLRSDETRY